MISRGTSSLSLSKSSAPRFWLSAAGGVAKALATVLLPVVAHGQAEAVPYVPERDAQVLEQVRPADDPVGRELARLRAALRDDPDDFAAADKLIRRYIELAREQGDPRYEGYAEAVLEPWLEASPVRPAALLLRATLLQRRHDFDGAIEDLDRLLARDRSHPQARLTRASLHQLRADYDLARQDCEALNAASLGLVRRICLAGVASLTGEAEAAYAMLRESADELGERTPRDLKVWAFQTLGDIAARRGQAAEAEGHYRDALAAGGKDLVLRGAFFDLLLEQGRLREALEAIGDDLRADPVLLRHVLAAQALGDQRFSNLVKDLEARFAASTRRGDALHLREEARFRLAFPDQAARSLKLAQRNWQSQREPEDARILVEAALAADRPAAAEPVIAWAKKTRLEDVRLASLITRVEEALR